jgi:signal peptidase I
VAHRIRYVPLACIALGAILMWLGPKPHRTAGDQLEDNSMAPTIVPGELVRVDRRAFARRLPRVGDLVSFTPPAVERCAISPPRNSSCPSPGRAAAAGDGVKRIVAGPGDWVAIVSGHLLRDGHRVAEPYVRIPCTARAICDLPKRVHLPPGTWWLLSDNRNAANDSRTYGPIPGQWIDGLVRIPERTEASAAGPPSFSPDNEQGGPGA